MEDRIYSVYDLNLLVKNYLEENELFQNFFLKGEVSNITYYKSGHLYFTLKDEKASVKCVAFYYKYKKISGDLKEGDLLKIFGKVSLYEANGNYQILVSHVEKEENLGVLFAELEKNKKEMAELGYFDELRKKPLPFLPKTIGIVTSGTGAALWDIINTARQRFPNIDFIVYPCKVQGAGSAEEIIFGIETLNEIEEVDVIIAGRGGGSIEDLWSFNTREVAMAYYNSKKPIISAVGHEIDVMLSDFTADLRASTPTQASELLVPKKSDLEEKLILRRKKIKILMDSYLSFQKERLKNKKETYILKNFSNIFINKNMELLTREDKLKSLINNRLREAEHSLEIKKELLKGLNPKEILKRGYTITTKDGKVIKDYEKLSIEDNITTHFYKGSIVSKVKEKL